MTFVGNNTKEYWSEKHHKEGNINKPYPFEQIGDSPESDHTIASLIIKENQDEIKNKSMLEIGCSVGFFCSYMSRFIIPDWKIEGWDFSQDAIYSAKHKNENQPNISFSVVDILETPVKNDYGIICSFQTIEHFEEGTNYRLIDNWVEHCEYLIIATVDTEDDCFGEHISHYKIDTFAKKGYDVVWSSLLAPIQMPNGTFHYFINLIKGKL